MVKGYGLTIFEDNSFSTLRGDDKRVHVGFDMVFVVTVDYVVALGSFGVSVSCRRMVAGLFCIKHSSISHSSLVSFPQNRVQRLIKIMILPQKCDRSSNDSSHSFDRIFERGCVVQVKWENFVHSLNFLEQTCRTHALDWERNRCYIQVPR